MPLTAPEKSVTILSAVWLSSTDMLLTPCAFYGFNGISTGPAEFPVACGKFLQHRQCARVTQPAQAGGNGSLELFPATAGKDMPAGQQSRQWRDRLAVADHGDRCQGIDLEGCRSWRRGRP